MTPIHSRTAGTSRTRALGFSMSEGGSAPTEARPLDQPYLAMERSGPLPILPAVNSSRTPPPTSALLEQMSRLDGCPECVTNAETPRTVHDAADGFTAYYRCHACGHAWATSWKD